MKIFLGISSFQMLAMFRRGLFYSYLTIYLRHFLGLSVTTTTLFATLPMIVNVVSQRYLWGVISDKYQKRRSLIVWGEILAGLGTLLLWACHLIPSEKANAGWVIIIGLSLIEVFWSMSNIGWSALISDIYEQGNRTKIMGKLESLGGVGRVMGVLAGGLLYDRMGTAFPGWGFYQGILFWISGAVMFASVIPMLMVPEGGMGKPLAKDSQETVGDPFVPRTFFIFITAMTLIHFGRNAVAVTMPQYLSLATGLNLSALTLSHVVNIRSLGIIITGLLAGRLCQRFGERRLLALSSVAAALALFILGIFPSLYWVCISSFLMGFSDVLIIAASYGLAAFYIPAPKRGTLFAVFNATFFLSWGMAGTLISGPITDGLIYLGRLETDAYRTSFNVSALITLVGVAVLLALFYDERRLTRMKRP
ncbi:MAG: MFS transporter [Proteobacteria bacterium]|nr:MFS transporter [Pseudomonadota bacterium]